MKNLEEKQLLELARILHWSGCPVCHGRTSMDTCEFEEEVKTVKEAEENWCNKFWLEYARKAEKLIIDLDCSYEYFVKNYRKLVSGEKVSESFEKLVNIYIHQ